LKTLRLIIHSKPSELVQPDVAPQSATRRTPTTRSQPANISESQGNSISAIVHSANDANTSAKRRKLDTDLDQEEYDDTLPTKAAVQRQLMEEETDDAFDDTLITDAVKNMH